MRGAMLLLVVLVLGAYVIPAGSTSAPVWLADGEGHAVEPLVGAVRVNVTCGAPGCALRITCLDERAPCVGRVT